MINLLLTLLVSLLPLNTLEGPGTFSIPGIQKNIPLLTTSKIVTVLNTDSLKIRALPFDKPSSCDDCYAGSTYAQTGTFHGVVVLIEPTAPPIHIPGRCDSVLGICTPSDPKCESEQNIRIIITNTTTQTVLVAYWDPFYPPNGEFITYEFVFANETKIVYSSLKITGCGNSKFTMTKIYNSAGEIYVTNVVFCAECSQPVN